jgi:hypothetical protein
VPVTVVILDDAAVVIRDGAQPQVRHAVRRAARRQRRPAAENLDDRPDRRPDASAIP